MSDAPKYSVVVPFYDEKENVFLLDKELREVMNELQESYELIYVDDGSSDGTLDLLESLKECTIISLNRNYGQATALDAGFKATKGDIIISLDGDLQNDPKDIPKLIEKLITEKVDVVAGWRKHRQDKNGVRILTRIGRGLRRMLISDPVHDTGCTLRVYRKKAVDALDLQGEMHRYILALLKWKGFKISEMVVHHRKRVNGDSKYGYSKAFRGFIDLMYIWFISKYSQRPLHLFGYLSLFSFLLGFAIEVWMFIRRISLGADVTQNGWFIVGFFFLGLSFLLFTFGIILDLLIKIKLDVSHAEKRYYIREILCR